jgi:ferritin-like metal-binding protein YciE
MIESLRKLYAAEHQIAWVLPKVLEGVSSQELKTVVHEYLAEAERHCERFHVMAKSLDETFTETRCLIAEAFAREVLSLAERRGDNRVLDLAIMAVLRHMVHFEKSTYEIARSVAEVCGEREIVDVVDEILSETEHTERSFILLTEDMMDSIGIKQESGGAGAPRSPLKGSDTIARRAGH